MDSRKLARFCLELADEKKAEDPVILDVRKLTTITNYFVIVTGNSEPHLRAIFEGVLEKLEQQHAVRPRAVDGNLCSSWVVLDIDDVIMHIMRAEARQHYDLEGLWGDAQRVRVRLK